ncbi:helix-turn-helix transcriptional regulator [Roseibium sp.]|uniref:helix-turn-helix transcriptional regulator n=1 Tax=Roseibium sp. TaxID=1936156 RepID=UPI003BB1DFCB
MTVEAEKYIHLTNLAVAAALQPDRWQMFLDELGQVLGTQVCTQLIGYDEQTKVAPLAYSSGYDPAILEIYETHYADKNPFAANFAKCAVGDVISTFQLCPPDKLRKTEFYADLLAPLEDITGGGGSMLAFDADRMFLIGGNMREKDRDRYEADWLQLCSHLAPVIRQSLEINRTISGLSFEKWAAEQHLLGSGTALFVVDPAMAIHYASSEAEALLASGTLVGDGFDRRLRFRSEKVQQEFSDFAHFQARGDHNIFKNWRLTGDDGRTWTCRTIGVRLADLDRTPFGIFMDKSISAILVALKRDVNSVSLQEQAQRLLGLSRAETDTVLKLADGLTPAEIAEGRKISVHTARNQVKSALAKTGCRRQSDLVRMGEQLRQQASWQS